MMFDNSATPRLLRRSLCVMRKISITVGYFVRYINHWRLLTTGLLGSTIRCESGHTIGVQKTWVASWMAHKQ